MDPTQPSTEQPEVSADERERQELINKRAALMIKRLSANRIKLAQMRKGEESQSAPLPITSPREIIFDDDDTAPPRPSPRRLATDDDSIFNVSEEMDEEKRKQLLLKKKKLLLLAKKKKLQEKQQELEGLKEHAEKLKSKRITL